MCCEKQNNTLSREPVDDFVTASLFKKKKKQKPYVRPPVHATRTSKILLSEGPNA